MPVPGEDAVPAQIFDWYVNERIGVRAIGARLTERGLRTRNGKPWNGEAVLTTLRNRIYLGEVYFRGTWYRAERHHPPLVDADVFEQAQQILTARGEDHTKRVAVHSDYALAGQPVCTRCGQRYIGTSATGNAGRYRYYTCFTRSRYGAHSCDGDLLPANLVEQAVPTALLDTYRRTDLVQEASAAVAATTSTHEAYQRELAAIDAETASVNAKTDRLRVEQLARRRAEVSEVLADPVAAPTPEQLAQITASIGAAAAEARPEAIRRLFERLVHEVRVAGRHRIQP